MKKHSDSGSAMQKFPLLPSVAACGLVLYLVWFFLTPFKPFASFFPQTPSRFSLVGFLIDPALIFISWFGQHPQFALFDRVPIYLCVSLCLVAAFGIGKPALTLLRFYTKLTPLERILFSTVTGLSIVSNLLLIISLLGFGNNVVMARIFTVILVACGLYTLTTSLLAKNSSAPSQGVSESNNKAAVSAKKSSRIFSGTALYTNAYLAVIIISTFYVLCGSLPSVEYDVISYHLPGVKETFETGYFGFRAENVYTNMPFGAEMFYLWGMLICDNSWQGALVGKTIIAITAILTGLGILCFCDRFFAGVSKVTPFGLIGLIVYLSNPWIFYVSVTGLIDGVVAMYLLYSVYALLLCSCPCDTEHANPESSGPSTTQEKRRNKRQTLVVGFLAGSAAACKYPAVLFVVVPIGIWLLWNCWLRTTSTNSTRSELSNIASKFPAGSFRVMLQHACVFICGVTLACGVWYAKNAVNTGNPVYPLLYTVFGDATNTWTPDKNAQWNRVHSPKNFAVESAVSSAYEFVVGNEYQSPILVPFAMIGTFVVLGTSRFRDKRNNNLFGHFVFWIVFQLVLYISFALVCWWMLTHRIDRFWIPIVPLMTLLAVFVCAIDTVWFRRMIYIACGIAVMYFLVVASVPTPGKYARLFLPLSLTKTDPVRVMPYTRYFNEHKPEGVLLLIGEAKAFDFEVPVRFSTCFDTSLFEKIVKPDTGVTLTEAEILKRFEENGVSDILVDWSEIGRFRSPGNYGFSKFITPDLFSELEKRGVLAPNHVDVDDPNGVQRGIQLFRVNRSNLSDEFKPPKK
ncbi:MAG: hypothetical protein ACRC2T_11255 [Thermoguttaceae bacterium]